MPAEMIRILQTNGTKEVGDYGILCLCAYLPNEPKYDPEYYQALEELELKLTDTYPYNLLARFYQVMVSPYATLIAGTQHDHSE